MASRTRRGLEEHHGVIVNALSVSPVHGVEHELARAGRVRGQLGGTHVGDGEAVGAHHVGDGLVVGAEYDARGVGAEGACSVDGIHHQRLAAQLPDVLVGYAFAAAAGGYNEERAFCCHGITV